LHWDATKVAKKINYEKLVPKKDRERTEKKSRDKRAVKNKLINE